jgi:hypothetical protein
MSKKKQFSAKLRQQADARTHTPIKSAGTRLPERIAVLVSACTVNHGGRRSRQHIASSDWRHRCGTEAIRARARRFQTSARHRLQPLCRPQHYRRGAGGRHGQHGLPGNIYGRGGADHQRHGELCSPKPMYAVPALSADTDRNERTHPCDFVNAKPFSREWHRDVSCAICFLLMCWQRAWRDPETDDKTTIFLGYTSNLISSGLRETLRWLVEHKHVSAIVTTAGGVEEDFIKCLAPTYLGSFSTPGAGLRAKGLNRIGNLVVPNSNYCAFEDWVVPILAKSSQGSGKRSTTKDPCTTGRGRTRSQFSAPHLRTAVWAICCTSTHSSPRPSRYA